METPLVEPNQIVPLRRDQFVAMIAAGMFEDDERIELLEGVLVRMSPQDDPHARTIVRLTRLAARVVGVRADVAVQVPFNAGLHSRPEPDLALWPPEDAPAPLPSQPFLVVEVSDSTLRKDRLLKGPIYASAGVCEYWIVNLRDSVVERHTDPGPDGYRRIEPVRRGDSIELLALPGARFAVDEILPPA